MRKLVAIHIRQLFLTLIFTLCYLAGNYNEYRKAIDVELKNLHRSLKHDEKLWLYAQAKLGDQASVVEILSEIKNKVFWYISCNHEATDSYKCSPYFVDSLGRDLENKETLLSGHELGDSPSIVVNDKLIQVAFPIKENKGSKFLILSHPTKNHYQINIQDLQKGFSIDRCNLSLKNPIKSFIGKKIVNLLILCLLVFAIISFANSRTKLTNRYKLYAAYKKRAIKLKAIEIDLKSTKLLMHGLRESNLNKSDTLISYSANYLLMHEKAHTLFEEFGKHQSLAEPKFQNILLVDVFRGKNKEIAEVVRESLKPLKSDLLIDEGITFTIEPSQSTGIFYSDHIFLSSFLLILFANLKNASKPQKIDTSLSIEIEEGDLQINLAGNFTINRIPSLTHCSVSMDTKKFGSTSYLQIIVKPLIKAKQNHQNEGQKKEREEEGSNVVKLFKK